MTKIDPNFTKIKQAIKKSGRNYKLNLIEKAFFFAKNAHKLQLRLTGQPYIVHPTNVALILIELEMDSNSIIAGLLHDVVEDTKITINTLEKEFGSTVAKIVEGVTKIKKSKIYDNSKKNNEHINEISDDNSQNRQIENIRKMLLAMSKDVRVIIIRLADRLHNMQTANGWPQSKRRIKALETMEIYAPLAQQLGMSIVKEKLQDLAIQILDPIAYNEISKMLTLKQKKQQSNSNTKSYINYLENKTLKAIKPLINDVQISGRVKSHYAIYFKLYIDGKEWDEVFDIYAIRIIVNSILECYIVLGIIHNLFKPLQNRFKDYIATPKANFYQSLHTTVMDKNSVPFEIQIRTKQMHYVAEYGIAAHWKYKQKIKIKSKMEEKLAWVRRIIELQKESENVDDFFQMFKTDLNSEEIFVFTPKGELKTLPETSTIIDFAYLISADIGNKMIGAKINGKFASIETKLESNQIVEIITTNSKTHGPQRRWLSIAKTSEARNKIRAWFKKERHNENIKRGMKELNQELSRNNINNIKLNKNEKQKLIEEICKSQNFKNTNDFYAAAGYGAINISKIISKFKKKYLKSAKNKTVINNKSQAIKISKKSTNTKINYNINNYLITLSKCCNPIPGCKIIGYITKHNTISVHCINCSNIKNLKNKFNKATNFINVFFDENFKRKYVTNLKIIVKSNVNVVNVLNNNIAKLKIKIQNLEISYLNFNNMKINIRILVSSTNQLKHLTSLLSKTSGIISIKPSTKL